MKISHSALTIYALELATTLAIVAVLLALALVACRREEVTHFRVPKVAAQTTLLGVIRGPVADAAIDDGFGLHTGTPEKAESLLTQRTRARKELVRILQPVCRLRPSNQATSVITSASAVSTANGRR